MKKVLQTTAGEITGSEEEKKEKWIRTSRWIYWTLTLLITSTMILAGILLLMGASANLEGIARLGYPMYLAKILGVAKVLGGIAILQNRFATLKEWAYAGYTFNLIGASASHAFAGEGTGSILTPLVILLLLLISCRQWKTGWM